VRTRPFTVAIDKGGPRIVTRGVAEIVAAGQRQKIRKLGLSATLAPAIGPLTFTFNGHYNGCTAEALAGVSVVMTAKHCPVDLPSNTLGDNFQFAPAERGDCWAGERRSLAACAGDVSEPEGYWCGKRSDVYREASAAQGPAFIVMWPCGASKSLPKATHGGIPVTFNPYRGLSWTAFGYPVYVPGGHWMLDSCGPVLDESGAGTETSERGGVLFGKPCPLGSGVSGGPWVNARALSPVYAIGAVNEKSFPPPTRLPNGQEYYGPDTYATGSYLGDIAMQEYIAAVLATGVAYPVVSKASVSHPRFSVGRRHTARVSRLHHGTVFRYRLDRRARVTIRIQRHDRSVMRLIRHGRRGLNRTPFSGRVGARTLHPGRYRAVIEARDRAGDSSLAPARVAFTVVPPA
jgi:hypothetical protein